jgi:hypothetical protein
MAGIGGSEIILLLILIGLRVVGVIYCSKRAVKFNRNKTIWGIAGISSPILAMILINLFGRKK